MNRLQMCTNNKHICYFNFARIELTVIIYGRCSYFIPPECDFGYVRELREGGREGGRLKRLKENTRKILDNHIA